MSAITSIQLTATIITFGPKMDVDFPNFVPVHLIDIGALVVLVFVVIGLLYQIIRWHRVSIPRELFGKARRIIGSSAIIATIAREIKEDALQVKPLYARSKTRWMTHAAIMWGFVGLALTTTLAYIFNPSGMPMPFTWPVRVLGNMSGSLVVIGCSIFFYRLLTDPAERNALTIRADITFFSALFLTAITGFVTEFYGYGADPLSADIVYGTHLALVVLLLGSAPFTRFLHAIMTPYFAVFERLRIRASAKVHGVETKYKERRIADYVAETFYHQPKDQQADPKGKEEETPQK